MTQAFFNRCQAENLLAQFLRSKKARSMKRSALLLASLALVALSPLLTSRADAQELPRFTASQETDAEQGIRAGIDATETSGFRWRYLEMADREKLVIVERMSGPEGKYMTKRDTIPYAAFSEENVSIRRSTDPKDPYLAVTLKSNEDEGFRTFFGLSELGIGTDRELETKEVIYYFRGDKRDVRALLFALALKSRIAEQR